MEAELGRAVVAAGEPEIADAIQAAGGEAVLTRPDHPSGSDRIFEALERIDPDGGHDAVINVQGDLPVLEPAVIRAALDLLADPAVDIGTVAAEITDPAERESASVNKPVAFFKRRTVGGEGRLYFTKFPAPWGDGPVFHHIGLLRLSARRPGAFRQLATVALERRERLEQLRALEAGMRIDVARVDTVPLGVDTPADLDRARALWPGTPRRRPPGSPVKGRNVTDPTRTIAFQGMPGAYSHAACQAARPDLDVLPCASFEDMLLAVQEERALCAAGAGGKLGRWARRRYSPPVA